MRITAHMPGTFFFGNLFLPGNDQLFEKYWNRIKRWTKYPWHWLEDHVLIASEPNSIGVETTNIETRRS
jgi:hypothetical protein